MTQIQNQLRNASFRGVNFLVKNSRIQFSPGSIVHRYPNSSRVEVEYLGEGPRQFSLEMIIKGSGDQYFRDRKALITALVEQSDGILLHPYDGEINCAVINNPDLNENDIESGVAKFFVDFIRVDNKIYPTETSDNTSAIESVRDLLESFNLQYIEDTFNLEYSEAYQSAKLDLENISDLYDGVTNSATIASSSISRVKNVISNFNNNILRYLSGEDDLSSGLVTLYNSLTGIAQTPADQLRLWFDFFDSIPANPIYEISTSRRRESLNNTNTFSTSAKVQTLGNIYNYTTEMQFASVDEIDTYREQLESRYQEIVQVDTSIPSTYLSMTGLNDPDVAYNLGQLRSEVQIYLDSLENTVGEVITIENVQPTTLTNFVYSYYGNLDKYDEVKDLNSIPDPTEISGDLQIII